MRTEYPVIYLAKPNILVSMKLYFYLLVIYVRFSNPYTALLCPQDRGEIEVEYDFFVFYL